MLLRLCTAGIKNVVLLAKWLKRIVEKTDMNIIFLLYRKTKLLHIEINIFFCAAFEKSSQNQLIDKFRITKIPVRVRSPNLSSDGPVISVNG